MLLILVLVGGAAFVGLRIVERAVIYPFSPLREDPPAGLTEVEVPTPDGKRLVVWTAPPTPGRATVLYFHGNAGNLAGRAGRFEAFLSRGLGVVAAGYRGSSGSTGWPSEQALVGDALTLRAVLPDLVGDGPVVCYGESLGAAVATRLAALDGCDALVLEAPFTSISDMGQALYGIPRLDLLARSHWRSVGHIRTVTVPLTVLHGTEDRLIPFGQGEAVFEAAASPDKTFVPLEGGGHTNLWQPPVTGPLFLFLDRI
nr:alpha/beta fold hydrolase [Maritimibacter sp. DP1N21-5]